LQCLTNASTQIIQDLVPGYALPLTFAAFASTPQWIKNALRIIHLVDGCRSLGTVAAPASRMRGVSFEFLDAYLLFVNVGQEPACRFTIETDGRDQGVVPFDFARPLRRIVFCPIVPTVCWWKAGEAALR